MRLIRTLLFTLGACLGAGASAQAQAQYPENPIKAVVPFPAGQATDILARLFTAPLSDVLKQPVYVENKGGAGGIIGIEAARRSPNDGYTILLASSGPLSINQNLYKDIPYDTLRDFDPVAMMLVNPQFLVVREDFPASNLEELIEVVKKNPGKYNYGSGGVGLTNHLTMEMLKQRTGMDIRHVPYRGATAALSGLIAGDTAMMFESGPPIIPHVQAGKLKIIAVGRKERSDRFPDVPSVHEAGVEGFDAATWIAVMVPKGTPQPVIERLNAATNEVLQQPGIRKQFADVTASAMIATPEQTRAFIDSEIRLWRDTIRKGNIQAE